MGNDLWTKKYQDMIKLIPRSEAEETALRLLNEGAGIIEAQEISGLEYEEYMELLARAGRYEKEVLCVVKKELRPDTGT